MLTSIVFIYQILLYYIHLCILQTLLSKAKYKRGTQAIHLRVKTFRKMSGLLDN